MILFLIFLILSIIITVVYLYNRRSKYNEQEVHFPIIDNNIVVSTTDDIDNITSWTLVDFARKHGQMKVTTAYNAMFKKECLDKCVFVASDGKETIAYIADVVKTYTPKMIEENKDKLHIRVLDSGYYCLCENRLDIDLYNS